MKIYLNKNVYEAAIERIEWVFDNFDNVVASISGGKDSDVVFNLAMIVAKKKGRLPLKVFWLDQEIEWQMVADHVKDIMYRDDVDPVWIQVPFRMSNATSTAVPYLDAWDEGKKDLWIRDKDPVSIKENTFGEDRFAKMFPAIAKAHYPDEPVAYLAGVRCEESPTRFTALTSAETYKGVTWGKILNKSKNHYTFYPIYDWVYSDVWKAIHDNKWDYCKLYDYHYQYGCALKDMRVSNLNHETAVKNLFMVHEIEPETWSKVSERLRGTNTAKTLGFDMIKPPKELPFMFESWREYRDYLVDKLYDCPKKIETFRKKFAKMDEAYARMNHIDDMHRIHVKSLMANDHEFVICQNWEQRADVYGLRKFWKGIKHKTDVKNKYIDWSKENAQ